MKNIVILGSTGSIGRQALEVIREFPDRFKIVGLAAGKNWRLLAEQIRFFKPELAALFGEQELKSLRNELGNSKIPDLTAGKSGLTDLATLPQADIILVALSGAVGIQPTIAAINAGKDIALANKETLVAAGQLVMELAAKKESSILPVDSEHSAIWQCFHTQGQQTAGKIILTASGGPFRCFTKEQMTTVTVDMALVHPNWQMGHKITIDSATLMNKGLEVIEAKWLFGVSYEQIEVVLHPQSIIHSAVEFIDGSIIAQLGLPDMRLPIQYALSYPERLPSAQERLKLTDLTGLTFAEPDWERFPALQLAFTAGTTGGTMPAVLNAANEVAVDAFLKKNISFSIIPSLVERVMEQHLTIQQPELAEIMEADSWARRTALHLMKSVC